MLRVLSTILAAIVMLVLHANAYGADAETEARIARLSGLLRNDSAFKVRAYAAQQLGVLASIGAKHDPKIIAALSHGLRDSDPIVRAMSADALAKHDAKGRLAELEKLAREDSNELVRRTSLSAIARLQPASSNRPTQVAERTQAKTPKRVALGKVQLEGSQPLTQAITDAIEDLIEPHRPAMCPREDPDVRLDVVVTRGSPKSDGRGGLGLSFQAKCVLIELPGAQLRKASNATATAVTTKRGAAIPALEKELALKAATRAVTEALAMLDEEVNPNASGALQSPR